MNFIEKIFFFSPDGGSGAIEVIFLGAAALVLMFCIGRLGARIADRQQLS